MGRSTEECHDCSMETMCPKCYYRLFGTLRGCATPTDYSKDTGYVREQSGNDPMGSRGELRHTHTGWNR